MTAINSSLQSEKSALETANGNQRTQNRIPFIDYLRGFMVVLVVLDHSMHAYAPHFKKMWYLQDFGGELIFDILHMHNDVIMMPFLFLLAGMFVLPSLKRRGLLSFSVEKFWRLVVPFTLGVIFLVPPQKYIKYLVTASEKNLIPQDYIDYWMNTFFWQEAWSSAFWFIAYLFALTLLLVILSWTMPFLIKVLGKVAKFCVQKPVLGFLSLCLFSCAVIGISELIWGAHYWFSLRDTLFLGEVGKLFGVRKARFLMEGFFFFLGAGVAEAGILKSKEHLDKIGQSWLKWTVLTLLVGSAYISYALMNFYDGAYSLEILRHFHFGGTWENAWPLIESYGMPILIRTTLMGIFLITLTGFYLSVFYAFLNGKHKKWQSLAACSFGIYIFHEPIVLYVHYLFYYQDISAYLKFAAAAGAGLFLSWALTHFLQPLPGFKKVL